MDMSTQFNSKSTEEGKKVVFQPEPKLHPGLYEAISEILKPGSDNGLLAQYTKFLKKFRLHSNYDAAFVLNESYVRACKSLDAGKKISNYSAWMRKTGYNFVRELSRDEKKTQNHSELDIESISTDDDLNWTDGDLETVEQKRMRQAFATLLPLEQAILQLKVIENLRWPEIQTTLITSGFSEISLNSLSQKKSRALRKLRKAYLNIAA
jgi:DNA-directed RNA polymerase specialized sigma24 family protein